MTNTEPFSPRSKWNEATRPIEERVEAFLGQMTLDEKLAQLGGHWDDRRRSDGVIATLKQFAGHFASRGGPNHAPVTIGRRELADVILPPVEMAVRAGGVRSVMNSCSELDGVPVAADRHLLTELLRDRWCFTSTTPRGPRHRSGMRTGSYPLGASRVRQTAAADWEAA